MVEPRHQAGREHKRTRLEAELRLLGWRFTPETMTSLDTWTRGQDRLEMDDVGLWWYHGPERLGGLAWDTLNLTATRGGYLTFKDGQELAL